VVRTNPKVITMIWLNDRPLLPGFYWFKGTVNFSSLAREATLTTIIELTGFVQNAKVWFPQKALSIPIRECEGQWAGTVGGAAMSISKEDILQSPIERLEELA
jgi:hypothetical protein